VESARLRNNGHGGSSIECKISVSSCILATARDCPLKVTAMVGTPGAYGSGDSIRDQSHKNY
jgi:hypothetical protein